MCLSHIAVLYFCKYLSSSLSANHLVIYFATIKFRCQYWL